MFQKVNYSQKLCFDFYDLQTELDYMGRLHHKNLVKLIGYCSENENRLLVYEFMPKGCLDNHLFRSEYYFLHVHTLVSGFMNFDTYHLRKLAKLISTQI